MNTDELIFVVVKGQNNALTAIEGNIGIVAFGTNIAEIRNAILVKVQEYFNGKFRGEIRIRRFKDIVINI